MNFYEKATATLSRIVTDLPSSASVCTARYTRIELLDIENNRNAEFVETRLDVVTHIPEILDNGIVRMIIRHAVARECLRTRKQRVVRDN